MRFSPLLSQLKKQWNVSVEKYATFWHPGTVLHQLSQWKSPLEQLPLDQLRKRLILCWRLLALHRGVDLSRTQRTLSFVNEKVFILVQRKGWKFPKWEEVIVLPQTPQISPFHLMFEYVKRTQHMVQHKNNLLWSLDGKKPLTSNTVNSLTKASLAELGVDTTHWKPHSTRGAGVLWWKSAGLKVEEIQQLGQWKNASAFQAHYLRLGVASRAKEAMEGGCTEPHHPKVWSPSGLIASLLCTIPPC